MRWLVPIALATACLTGCVEDETVAPGDAEAWCDEQRTANAGCFDDDTYDACVTCYTDCGEPCPVAESCPVQFPSCP